MKFNLKEKKKKQKKSNQIEYFIIFGLSGFIAMKLIAIHDINQPYNDKLIYLSAFCILIFLFSAAKAGLFNIFKYIRKVLPSIKMVINYLKKDFIDWRKKEGYYVKK